jgi:phosphoribosylformylglycinamidine synthase
MQFVCKNIFITNDHDSKKQVFKIPVAHGEGRYYADEHTLDDLEKHEQILYRYCDEKGNISNIDNPNGSTLDIAGICNFDRNIMGMMPHPERACSKVLGNEDGKIILSDLFSIN